MNAQLCGQRAVKIELAPSKRYTGSCIEPKGHGTQHRDADGNTWIESVR